MKKREVPLFPYRTAEALYYIFLLTWALLPLALTSYRGIHVFHFPSFYFGSDSGSPAIRLFLKSGVYLMIAAAFSKAVSLLAAKHLPLLEGQEPLVPALVDVLASTLAVFFIMLYVFRSASGGTYLRGISVLDYAVLFASLTMNATALVRSITALNARNNTVREYMEYRKYLKDGKSMSAGIRGLSS